MPPPLRNLSDLGYIIEREGVYNAEVLARDLKIHFRGPRRGRDKERASEDLAAIRAAATDHMTRAEAVGAMKHKADELKNGHHLDSRMISEFLESKDYVLKRAVCLYVFTKFAYHDFPHRSQTIGSRKVA